MAIMRSVCNNGHPPIDQIQATNIAIYLTHFPYVVTFNFLGRVGLSAVPVVFLTFSFSAALGDNDDTALGSFSSLPPPSREDKN